jgi:hypothetical protein
MLLIGLTHLWTLILGTIVIVFIYRKYSKARKNKNAS